MRDFDEEPANPAQSARKLLAAADRRKWPALLTFLGLLAAVVSIVTFLPDVYRSTATVIIKRQQIPNELVRSTVTSALDLRLRTIAEEALSRQHLEELIDKFELYPSLRQEQPMEKVLDRMRKDISISMGSGKGKRGDQATIAFSVGYSASDAVTAARVAGALTDYFINENIKVRSGAAKGTATFLRNQLQQARTQLDSLEQRVSVFKQTHIGSLPQQMEANLATLEQLNAQLRLNSDRQAQNTERRTALEGQRGELLGALGEGRTPDERLAQLHGTLGDLKTRYSDKHPDIIRVRVEIAALEEQVRERQAGGGVETTFVNPQLTQLQRALDALDIEGRTLGNEAGRLRASIVQYQRRVEMTPAREQEFASLSREYETTQELYRTLVSREREAVLAENMEQRQQGEQFQVLDPPLPPQEPTAPKRGLLLFLGLVLALGAAAAVAVVLEVMDPSLHDPDELQGLTSIPVIATIPRIVTAAEEKVRRRRVLLGSMVSAAGLVAIVGLSFLLTRYNNPVVAFLLK